MTQTKPTITELSGHGASPGIATGPLYRPTTIVEDAGDAKNAQDNRQALEDAIARSGQQLAELLASLGDSEEAGIIEFQVAMLEDEALSEAAFETIEAGRSAATGWREALDRQISDYRSAEDEYFAARAADLQDIRDRVLHNLPGMQATSGQDGGLPDAAIVLTDDLSPSRFLEIDWQRAAGIVLREGSHLSHVAILARARGVPMVVGIGDADTSTHEEAIVDGDQGKVVFTPDAAMRARYRQRQREHAARRLADEDFLSRPAISIDGRTVKVMVNISDVAELDSVDCSHCDGIGLMRSEFLLGDRQTLLDEDRQYSAYRRMLEWAQGKPVTIRTLDAGGDKPIEGLTQARESNPFLGLRGLRLSLARPDVFKVQCRALARAAVHGRLNVMFPMVTHEAEFSEALAFFDSVQADLLADGVACQRPTLGLMLEVPSAVLTIERFSDAEFFSVGSNDLLHYLSATARDDESLQRLAQHCEALMWDLIRTAKAKVDDSGRSVSLCGDAAADPQKLGPILGTGLSTVSVSVARLAATKAAICAIDLGADGDTRPGVVSGRHE